MWFMIIHVSVYYYSNGNINKIILLHHNFKILYTIAYVFPHCGGFILKPGTAWKVVFALFQGKLVGASGRRYLDGRMEQSVYLYENMAQLL